MEQRKRKVFGRRKVTHDGVTYRVEMRKDRLVIRELYSRRERVVTLVEFVEAALGQMRMKLN